MSENADGDLPHQVIVLPYRRAPRTKAGVGFMRPYLVRRCSPEDVVVECPRHSAEGNGYGWPPSTKPMRTAHTTSCCLVLNPSFLCIPDMALRTVSALMFRISPISW